MFLKKNTAIEFFEIIVFTFLFFGALLVFFNLDKNFLIDNQYFPWDSYHYNIKELRNLEDQEEVNEKHIYVKNRKVAYIT
jgi:hypothetical protein